MTVPSPCQNICILDDEQVCIGCRRTMEEVANWGKYTDNEKIIILDRLKKEELEDME